MHCPDLSKDLKEAADMKESVNAPTSGEFAKTCISKQLYVQVEERLNLRKVLSRRHDLMNLQTMARKMMEQEGKNREQ